MLLMCLEALEALFFLRSIGNPPYISKGRNLKQIIAERSNVVKRTVILSDGESDRRNTTKLFLLSRLTYCMTYPSIS